MAVREESGKSGPVLADSSEALGRRDRIGTCGCAGTAVIVILAMRQWRYGFERGWCQSQSVRARADTDTMLRVGVNAR